MSRPAAPHEALGTDRQPRSRRSSAWKRGGNWARAVLAAAVVLLLVWLGRGLGGYLPQLTEWVENLGIWAPVAFIAAYTVAVVAFVPGSLLTLAAGAIFGVGWGMVYAFTGATLGAAAAFLVARYLARSAVERRLRGNARFRAIDEAIGREGFKIVLLLRLSPVFPFNLLNYSLGLTRVRFPAFLLASVGMLPGTLLYVYYGRVAGDVAALAGGAEVGRGIEYYAVLLLGLLATIAVTVYVTRLARRALQQEIGMADD